MVLANSSGEERPVSTATRKVEHVPRFERNILASFIPSYFERHVQRMADEQVTGFDANRALWQSRIVNTTLHKFAIKHKLNLRAFFSVDEEVFYPELRDRYRELLKLPENLCISNVFAQKISNEHTSFWLDEQDRSEGRLKVFFMPTYDSTLNHYCSVGNAYRFEETHTPLPTDKVDSEADFPARFSFNDPPFAAKLHKYADYIENLAIRLTRSL